MRVLKNNVNRLTSTFSVYPSFLLLSVLTLSISLLLSSFAIPYNVLAQSQQKLRKQVDRFDNFNASKPFMLNNPGTFTYSGPSYDRAVPNYKMNGSITVVNQPLATNFNNTNTLASSGGVRNNSIDAIATLMVPSKLLSKTISELKSQGFTIDNQHSFTSIRGGGSAAGGDKQQVLLVLTSSGKNLNQVTSALAQVASTLPYK